MYIIVFSSHVVHAWFNVKWLGQKRCVFSERFIKCMYSMVDTPYMSFHL